MTNALGKLSCALLAAIWVLSSHRATADVVVDWNEMTNALQSANRMEDTPDVWSVAREAWDIVPVAIFQAVNTIEGRYTPYRQPLAPAYGPASSIAAAVAAAHAVLLEAFPASKEQLDNAYLISLASVPEGPQRVAGIEVGERAAAQVIAWRTADHAAAGTPYRPVTQPGQFIFPSLPTIPAWFVAAKPWLVSDRMQIRPDKPPDLKSTTWARDYNESKTLGGRDSTVRTAQQTLLARFWYTHRWGATLRQVATQPGRGLDQNARLYALATMAEADASQAMGEAKLIFDFWRPITAIRNGDRDGNDATERQADWEPLIKTPPHEEYPCGHCVDSMTIATVLRAEGPPPAEGVAVTSDAVPNAVLYVQSYEAMADQISESRIHAGAHFRSSLEAGKAMGRKIAEYALKNFLTPVH